MTAIDELRVYDRPTVTITHSSTQLIHYTLTESPIHYRISRLNVGIFPN